MSRILLKNATAIATMDDERRELANADLLVEGRVIAEVGPDLEERGGDTVIDASGCLVLPGFVNTHNHLFQTLYRVTSGTQEVGFVDWLGYLAGIWGRMPPPPEAIEVSALVNFAEMLMTGTTTSADQHYPYWPGQPPTYVDRTIDAAQQIGIRFHPARGCCTLGQSEGGLVPDEIAQDEQQVLEHAQELITKYHDPEPFSMVRLVLAPLAPYSDTETIYREMRALADLNPKVHLHTHLHEIADLDFCLEKYGLRPVEFMERCGWLGEDVVLYHMSAPTPNEADVKMLAETGTYVSQCLGSDMRLSYEWMPMRELLDAGGNVCLGTTGCASNLGGHILIEARLTLAAHRMRIRDPETYLSARDILWIATRGGAEALGRDDIGVIAPGKAADIAVFDLDRVDRVGHHDPLAALLYCGASHYTKATLVDGRLVVRDGELVTVDEPELVARAKDWAARLMS